MTLINKEEIIALLKQCYDPEIPVDLWNLGLIYDIDIQEAPEEQGSDVNITMTLTTPGCGMAQHIARGVMAKLEEHHEINQALVQLTFDPPWNPEMISEEARQQLGLGEPQPTQENISGGLK